MGGLEEIKNEAVDLVRKRCCCCCYYSRLAYLPACVLSESRRLLDFFFGSVVALWLAA
jgi:hypothetical protein